MSDDDIERAALRERVQRLALSIRTAAIRTEPADRLIALARELDVAREAALTGSRYRAELAYWLVQIYRVLDARLVAAPMSADALPQLPGLTWNARSPLAGALIDIIPFGSIDIWAMEARRAFGTRGRRGGTVRRPTPPDPPPDVVRGRDWDHLPPLEDGGRAGRRLGEAGRVDQGPSGGFLDDIMPPEAQVAGDLIINLALELSGTLAGPIVSGFIMFLGFANTLDANMRTQVRAAAAWGIRLGMVALDFLEPDALPGVTRAMLLNMIRQQGSLSRQWNSQIAYGGSSGVGPDLIRARMEDAVGTVAHEFRGAARTARERLERVYAGPPPPDVLAELYARVRENLLAAVRRRFDEVEPPSRS
jgi:hypothetical protein